MHHLEQMFLRLGSEQAISCGAEISSNAHALSYNRFITVDQLAVKILYDAKLNMDSKSWLSWKV